MSGRRDRTPRRDTVAATDDDIDQRGDDRVCAVAIATISSDLNHNVINATITVWVVTPVTTW